MKKKTGHQTPEYRRHTAPPQPTIPPMPQVTKPKQPNKDCAYSTPCGWCTKWDKKCDKKIPERGLRAKANIIDETVRPCNECDHKGWDMPQCKECNIANGFKYFERKKTK